MTLEFPTSIIVEYLNKKMELNELESIIFSLGDIAEKVRFCSDSQELQFRSWYFYLPIHCEVRRKNVQIGYDTKYFKVECKYFELLEVLAH